MRAKWVQIFTKKKIKFANANTNVLLFALYTALTGFITHR